MTDQAAIHDVPLSGGAVVRGASGKITLQWLTFGDVADAELTEVDLRPRLGGPDPELGVLTGQSLFQVARDLGNQGVTLRFTREVRVGHDDALGDAVVATAGMQARAVLHQLRAKAGVADTPAGAPQGVTVRPIDLDADAEAWTRLHEASFPGAFVRAVDTPAGIQARLAALTPPAFTVLVVPDPEIPGQLIAAVSTVRHQSAPGAPVLGEIAALSVDPDWRRQGVGSYLLSLALADLAEHGARTVVAYVEDADEAGQALFARHGFKLRAHRTYYSLP